MVLAGEAGIGKTRLVDEFVRGCDQRAQVLRGSCAHLAGTPLPLAPFRTVLTTLSEDGGSRRWAEPGALFDAVTRELVDLSRAGPVLLIVEDLHWADESTLDLVDYLARALRDWGVLLLVNVRTDPHGDQAIDEALQELSRLPHALRLDLRRLTPQGVARQMFGILGHPPDATMAERVSVRSEGVPFLVEELTAAELDGQHGVPEHLHDLLLRRTRGLSPDAATTLRAAAAAPTVTTRRCRR